MPVLQQEESFAFQGRDRKGLGLAEQGVLLGTTEQEGIPSEGQGFQIPKIGFQGQDRRLLMAFGDGSDEVRRAGFGPEDRELRKVALKGRSDAGEQVGRHRRDDAETQGTCERIGEAPGVLNGILGCLEEVSESRQEKVSCGSDADARTVPLEEDDAQGGFQGGHLVREGGLGHGTAFGRSAEAARFGHRQHVLSLP